MGELQVNLSRDSCSPLAVCFPTPITCRLNLNLLIGPPANNPERERKSNRTGEAGKEVGVTPGGPPDPLGSLTTVPPQVNTPSRSHPTTQELPTRLASKVEGKSPPIPNEAEVVSGRTTGKLAPRLLLPFSGMFPRFSYSLVETKFIHRSACERPWTREGIGPHWGGWE